MSAVDDNNLMQLQSNTVNMIEHHFQKRNHVSTTKMMSGEHYDSE